MILMAVVLYIVFISLLYVIYRSSFISSFKNDIFNPANVFFLWFFLETPFLLISSVDPSALKILTTYNVDDLDYLYAENLLFNAIYILVFVFVGCLYNKIFLDNKVNYENYSLNISNWKVIWFLGFIVYLYYLNSIGGLSYLWQNLVRRTEITQGTGYISTLYNTLITVAIVILVKSNSNKFIKIVFSLATFLILISSGGRGPLLSIFVVMLITFNYCQRKIYFKISAKLLIVIILCAIFIVAAPLFRKNDALEFYKENPQELLDDSIDNVSHIFSRFSTLERNIVIYNEFGVDKRLWFGASFIDLITAPIPKGIFPDKPPVDEGVYISSIAHGYNVAPPTPAKEMLAVAWPLNNITVGYANFWLFGVIVFSALYSLVFSDIYRRLAKSRNSVFLIIIYSSLSLNQFGFTNLKIIKLITFCIIYACIFLIYKFFSKVLR